jgi:nucleobase:cation symporter-1, NCS1 family
MAVQQEGKAASTASGIELRSIDWVPHEERHGKAWHLGGVWFSGNAELTTTATGVLAISLGGNLLWTLVALLAGTLFGTFFTAFHSAQGPQLGLPQMIQSRAQFGYLGVTVLVLPFMVFNYAGYNVFNSLLAAEAVQNVVGYNVKVWLVIVTVIGVLAATWGYDLIHITQRWLTYLFIVFFGIYTIGVFFTIGLPAGAWTVSAFKATPFLGAFALAVSYQIGWAPYVSDYSRYLPARIGVKATFMWTYWGLVAAGFWMFAMGAIIAAPIASQVPSTIAAIRSTGDAIFGGFGEVVLILSVPALIMIVAMNMYGGGLILISMADSFKKLRPQLWHRIAGILTIAVVALAGAFYSTSNADFLGYYNNLIVLLLYFFAPWTAVNLVDYFWVRRGHYAIREIFNPDGIYHRWGWIGISSYLLGFVAMIPFMVIGVPNTKFDWWIGPIAVNLSYADISVFIGIPVSAIAYLILSRRLDLEAERALEAAEPHMTRLELEEDLTPPG